MTTKQAIVAELGAGELLTGDEIAKSLIANDQVKYYFALLQTASEQAERPNSALNNLKSDRVASRIVDEWLDDVVAGTRKVHGSYRVPHGPEILRRIKSAIEAMLACLSDVERKSFGDRLAIIANALPQPDHGLISNGLVSAMTAADRNAGDNFHLLVMDAHRAINQLQAATATDVVAGAKVRQLSDKGRKRVEAFMQGLNRTAPLKFDHPGLDTTAVEHGGLLLIQNDIGTTDAHVIVIRVADRLVTVTYTDIHKPRLEFFRRLLSERGLVWQEDENRNSEKLEGGHYILSTGSFEAESEDALLAFLDNLGSRIVFLIDWNRMRKRLRLFVGKKEAVTALKWAADHDYGHRALLEIGGEHALAEAVEYAACGTQLRYGVRLDELIDEKNAIAFIQDAMKLACDGLRQGRSRRNIKDEIKARLRAVFEKERLKVFDLAAEHAAIGFDLASSIVDALRQSDSTDGRNWIERFAGRANIWEARADQVLNDAREDIKRFDRPVSLLHFFEHADDAVDELEEACALIELTPIVGMDEPTLAKLRELAELALAAASELVRSIECAATITRSDVRDDLDEFMSALEKIIDVEHDADKALRLFRRHLIESAVDQRQLMVLRELAQSIETATDAYAHSGQALRSYLMEEVIA